MTIPFETDNKVIINGLENTISYAWDNHYIFIPHCIWWIASIIRLQQDLVIFINILNKRASVRLREYGLTNVRSERIAIGPEIQNISATIDAPTEDFRAEQILEYVERFFQRWEKPWNKWELSQDLKDTREPQRDSNIPDIEEIPVYSGREQRALRQQWKSDPLSVIWSGRVEVKPLTKEQENRLQAIPRDTLLEYLKM